MDKYAQWDAKKLMTNVTTEASVQMARHLSTQSHVLIKNEGAILPLSPLSAPSAISDRTRKSLRIIRSVILIRR